MTIIAALVDHHGTVHAASDTRTMLDGHRLEGAGADKLGVLYCAGEPVLFGAGGLSGTGQVARHTMRVLGGRFTASAGPAPWADDPTGWAFEFADLLTYELRDRGMCNGGGIADFTGLLGWDGRLWVIDHCAATPVLPSGGEEPTVPFAAVGAGREYAMGALHALVDVVDAEEALRRAVAAAGQLDCCYHAGFQTCSLPPVPAADPGQARTLTAVGGER